MKLTATKVIHNGETAVRVTVANSVFEVHMSPHEAKDFARQLASAIVSSDIRWHVLFSASSEFADIQTGARTCVPRYNDRGFKVGDRVRLIEMVVGSTREMVRVVTHVFAGAGLAEGWVSLSLAHCK